MHSAPGNRLAEIERRCEQRAFDREISRMLARIALGREDGLVPFVAVKQNGDWKAYKLHQVPDAQLLKGALKRVKAELSWRSPKRKRPKAAR